MSLQDVFTHHVVQTQNRHRLDCLIEQPLADTTRRRDQRDCIAGVEARWHDRFGHASGVTSGGLWRGESRAREEGSGGECGASAQKAAAGEGRTHAEV